MSLRVRRHPRRAARGRPGRGRARRLRPPARGSWRGRCAAGRGQWEASPHPRGRRDRRARPPARRPTSRPSSGPTIVHGDFRLDNCSSTTQPTRVGSRPCSTGSCPRSATRSPTSGCCMLYLARSRTSPSLSLIPAVTRPPGLPGPRRDARAVRRRVGRRPRPTWPSTRRSPTSSSPSSPRASRPASAAGAMGGQDFGDLDAEILRLAAGRPRPHLGPGRSTTDGLRTLAQGRGAVSDGCGTSCASTSSPPSRCGRPTCASTAQHAHPPVMEELKAEARARGLWNLFLPRALRPVQPRVRRGRRDLRLVAGHRPGGDQLPGARHRQHGDPAPVRHRRAEAAVARAAARRRDPVGVRDDRAGRRLLRRHQHRRRAIRRDGDDYVINGRKWWITGVADERCQIFIVMGKTDPDAETHRQQSMILVPRDTPGLTIERHLPIFGYQDQHGHSEIVFHDVRVPAANLLAGEGDGFMIAQARLGPGPHPPRDAGHRHGRAGAGADGRPGASRGSRSASTLAEQGVVQELIAQSRIEIDQARLLRLQDRLADRPARRQGRPHRDRRRSRSPPRRWPPRVIDRAIEVFGGSRRQRRHPARVLLRLGARPAHRRRPRRRAPTDHRARGAEEALTARGDGSGFALISGRRTGRSASGPPRPSPSR